MPDTDTQDSTLQEAYNQLQTGLPLNPQGMAVVQPTLAPIGNQAVPPVTPQPPMAPIQQLFPAVAPQRQVQPVATPDFAQIARPEPSLWQQAFTPQEMQQKLRDYATAAFQRNEVARKMTDNAGDISPLAGIGVALARIGLGRIGGSAAETAANIVKQHRANVLAKGKAALEADDKQVDNMAKVIELMTKDQYETHKSNLEGYANIYKAKADMDRANAYITTQDTRRGLLKAQTAAAEARSRFQDALTNVVEPKAAAQIAKSYAQAGQAVATTQKTQAQIPWIGPQAQSLMNYRAALGGAAIQNAGSNAARAKTYQQTVDQNKGHLDYLEQHGKDMAAGMWQGHINTALQGLQNEETLFNASDPETQKKMAPGLLQRQQQVNRLIKQKGLPPRPMLPTNTPAVALLHTRGLVPPPPPITPSLAPAAAALAQPQVARMEVNHPSHAEALLGVGPGTVKNLITAARAGNKQAKAQLLIHIHKIEQMSQTGTPTTETPESQPEEE